MATIKQPSSKPRAQKKKAARPLSSLLPAARAYTTVVDQVRDQYPAILAAWVEGHSMQDIGGSLDPMLSGYQITVAFTNDPELKKLYEAAREFKAHALVDSASSWAAVMGGKDGVESKLKVAGLLLPKTYGAKATLEHTGAGGGPIVATVALEPAEAYQRMLRGGA